MGNEEHSAQPGQQSNTVRPQPTPTDIAFYTIGDTRHFHGIVANTISNVYRQMAEVLAPGHAYGVQTRQLAIQRITTGLPQEICLRKIYFVGHGWHHDSGTSGFFFSGTGFEGGRELGLDDFHATSWDQTVSDTTHQQLVSAVTGRVCSGGNLNIEFLCCYAGGFRGGGDLLRSIETQITRAGIQNYRISGTEHEFRFEADEDPDTGNLLNWQNHLMRHTAEGVERIADTPDPFSPHQGIIPGNLRVLTPALP